MKTDLATVAIRSPRRALGLIGAALVSFGLAGLVLLDGEVPADNAPPSVVALAVLGDSSSHSYQDRLSFPPNSADRGGIFRARTFQWTEVLARLRSNELNPGPWVRWGQPGHVAWLRGAIGLRVGRTPRKEDYLYNFASSGASCNSLMGGALQRHGQAQQLIELMDHDPARWRSGLVVIRIGNNDWSAVLDDQARDPRAPTVRAVAAHCADQIGVAIKSIHAKHSNTRIMVVGVDNEMNEPGAFDKYRSAVAVSNMQTAFDDFNARLRELADTDARLGFFDLGRWFATLWGTREPDGTPTYKAVVLGGELRVMNSIGDEPHNAILADSHAGLVWNALWAQSLVARLREVFDLPLTPITDEELVRFVSAS